VHEDISMSFSSFSGPIRSGTVRYGSGANCGVAVLMQSATLPATAGATTVAVLPAGSQILDIIVDTTTLFNAATTLTIGDGTTANKYVTSTTITTAGRANLASTYQPLTFINVGSSDVAVIATTAGSAATGAANVTIMYAQKASDGSENPSTP
jgi:hypothetical protein